MSKRRPRVVPALVLLVTLGLLGLDAWWVLGLAQRPPEVARLRRGDAQRVLAYRVGASANPRFALDGDPLVLRLATHLLLRSGVAYDPARRARYELVLEVREGLETTWRRELAVDSRQSKGEPVGRAWRHEAAFTDDPDEQLTDERMLLVKVPATRPGAVLVLSASSPDGDEVLVRVFVERARSDAERERLAVVLDPEAREAMLASSTWVPWALVPPDEQRARLARRAERFFAVGERDQDYRLRTIYVSSFRSREAPTLPVPAIDVAPGRPAALLARGPATLRITSAAPLVAEARTALPGDGLNDPTVRITRVDAAGGVTTGTLVVGADPAGATSLEVPAGVVSIVLEADVARRLVVSGPAAAAFPPRDGLGEVAFGVHTASSAVELTGPERPALELPLWPGAVAGVDGRVVRLELRRVLEPAPSGPAHVRLRFVDGRGRPLGTQVEVLDAPPAPFERVHDDAAGLDASVSAEETLIAIAPPAASTLVVEADAPVTVRAMRVGTGPNVLAPTFAAVELGAARWRRAPLAAHRFLAFTSVAGRALERRAYVVGQTRLEPEAPAEATVDGPTSSLEPIEPTERQVVREAVPSDRLAAVLRDAPASVVTRLRPGESTQVVFAPTRPAAPRIAYVAPAAALGASITVTLAGAPPVTRLLRDVRGTFTLPRTGGGARELRVDAPAGVFLTIDRPPVSPRTGDVFVERSVYALDRTPLRVQVSKQADEVVAVGAVIYGPADATGVVRVVVGGGHPARRQRAIVQALTRADRSLPLPPPLRPTPAAFRDRDGDAGVPRAIAATLREDLAAGVHEVGVYSRAGRPLWIRFYVRRDERHEGDALVWRRAAPEDGP